MLKVLTLTFDRGKLGLLQAVFASSNVTMKKSNLHLHNFYIFFKKNKSYDDLLEALNSFFIKYLYTL